MEIDQLVMSQGIGEEEQQLATWTAMWNENLQADTKL